MQHRSLPLYAFVLARGVVQVVSMPSRLPRATGSGSLVVSTEKVIFSVRSYVVRVQNSSIGAVFLFLLLPLPVYVSKGWHERLNRRLGFGFYLNYHYYIVVLVEVDDVNFSDPEQTERVQISPHGQELLLILPLFPDDIPRE